MTHDGGFQPTERLLAVEVRSRRIGFAVFEGPSRLLDWGVRGCQSPTHALGEVVAKKVRPLLLRYGPFSVVMRRENQYLSQTAKRIRISIGAISREARQCGIKIRLLKSKSRRHFFAQFRYGAKHRVAELIADLFEELSWNVQPQRKAWHSEGYHTVIFDAVATGLVAFGDELNSESVQELIATTESFRRLP